jgi:hypothetical protein
VFLSWRAFLAPGYNIYDALNVSAALEIGCTTLYSEDLRDGQTIDGQLTIRNPFVGSSASNLVKGTAYGQKRGSVALRDKPRSRISVPNSGNDIELTGELCHSQLFTIAHQPARSTGRTIQ